MKERPILFSGPMVRALLDGRKTQTRRTVKPQPSPNIDDLHGKDFRNRAPYVLRCYETDAPYGFGFEDETTAWQCPYGQPGDRLWVKETSIIAPKRFATPDDTCRIDSDGDPRFVQYIASHPNTEAAGWYKLKKSPSIFMPRWAARITLEIVSVRVERLQDISEADAKAEGVSHSCDRMDSDAFFELWESINGPGSWAKNYWVWVIAFKKL